MPELRKDPISNRRVIIAGDRANRPGHSTATAPTEPCPFCAGNEAMTPPEVFAYRQKDTRADDTGWSVRIVTNKYPALLSNIREQECIEGI